MGHVARMVGKTEGKRLLARPRRGRIISEWI